MGIPIPTATRQQLDSVNTEAMSGKGPFPFVPKTWRNYTAAVTSVDIDAETDQIVVKAENGDYQVRIYQNLDPTKTGPGCTDIAAAQEKNLANLLKLGKSLGFIVEKGQGLEVEPKNFAKAKGKIISFGIIQAESGGVPKVSAKGYPVPKVVFSGIAPELKPVPTYAPHTAPAANQADDDFSF